MQSDFRKYMQRITKGKKNNMENVSVTSKGSGGGVGMGVLQGRGRGD